MSFYSDAHLLLGDNPALEVSAWQHPQHRDSFTVHLYTADRHGRIAITGTPSQLHGLLARMAEAVTEVATAAGYPDVPTSLPATPATTRS